jgi:hypothetical protein
MSNRRSPIMITDCSSNRSPTWKWVAETISNKELNMKSNSDQYPNLIVQSAGKTQIRYNITEAPKEEMDGSTKTSYDFDYVEIEGEVTKEKIIAAILAAGEPKPEPVVPVPEPEPEAKAIDVKMVEEAISEAQASIAAKGDMKPVEEPK